MRTFKICLIGEGGVGKSTFVKRYLTGEFVKRYVATLGVEVIPIQIRTNHGPIVFNVWDCAGQEKFGGLRDGYFIQADAAIIMFDTTSEHTLNKVRDWNTLFTRMVAPNSPKVLVGNKIDLMTVQNNLMRRVPIGEVSMLSEELGLPYINLSVKSNYGYQEPFLRLARILMGIPDLVFMPQPDAVVARL